MTTEAITRLRQRMIGDMKARKLCAGTQRGHILGCKRFAAFLKRSPIPRPLRMRSPSIWITEEVQLGQIRCHPLPQLVANFAFKTARCCCCRKDPSRAHLFML